MDTNVTFINDFTTPANENGTICVGEPLYCNYTYDEYIRMLHDYIYPSIGEWILIVSHAIVFFVGLVSPSTRQTNK